MAKKNELATTQASPVVIFDDSMKDLLKSQLLNDGIGKLTDNELMMIGRQVEKTGLDPLARQLYVTSSSVKKADGTWGRKLNIQSTIDGFRLVADRSGKYGGQSEPIWEYGAEKTELNPLGLKYAKIAVYRKDFEQPLWGVAFWDEYRQVYTKDKVETLGRMWGRMPQLMLAKCAEALALRKAFPQELSGLYTSDEMGAAENVVDVTPHKPADEPTEGEVVNDTKTAPAHAETAYMSQSQASELFVTLKMRGVTSKDDAIKAVKGLTVTDDLAKVSVKAFEDALKFVAESTDQMFKDMLNGFGVKVDAKKEPDNEGTPDHPDVTTAAGDAASYKAESGDTVITDLPDGEVDLSDIPF